MIVFTSDNGYFWGEHDLGGKHGPYEEAIRVPLLMRYPALIEPGTKLDQFALNIDLAPTLLTLANVPIPESMQGRDLLPLFKGDVSRSRMRDRQATTASFRPDLPAHSPDETD